ncbi:MAG: acetate--CoA ligase family protein [Acidimicrobiia bacterium]|jgi:acetyl-CoA synthetase (ADP-forming)|nr:acetate--CoA ligase family protein [Acidimicrobiia bacterium]
MGADRVEVTARLLREAAGRGRQALAEHEAKQVLAAYGLPVTREVLVATRAEVGPAAAAIGYPVALKASSPEIPHRTERGLVRLGRADEAALLAAYDAVAGAMEGLPGGVLVQEMVAGSRELAMGLVRDPDFGPCVMFGLGGILTEALGDAVFRRAPLDLADAHDMMDEIRGRRILEGVRGMPAADRGLLAEMLLGLGQIGLDHPVVQEVDVNPVLLAGARPVAADALIVLR